MGNRSKFVALATGAIGITALRKRRRTRLSRAAQGIRDSIMSSLASSEPAQAEQPANEAHAPGHRHLRWARTAEHDSDEVHRRERSLTRRARRPRYPRRG